MSIRSKRTRRAGLRWPGPDSHGAQSSSESGITPSRSRRPRCTSSGFTLVELIAVLTLVTLLAGTSVVSLKWLGSLRQNVAVARVKNLLVFAQKWAIGSGNHTWVEFDLASEVAAVFVEDPLNPGKSNRLIMQDPLTRGPMKVQLGSGRAAVESVDMGGTPEVEFDSDGAPRDAFGDPLRRDGIVEFQGGVLLHVTRSTGLILGL